MPYLILNAPAMHSFFFLLLECANKYLWSGLTNTSCIINAEFTEVLANHIRNLMQQ